MKKLSILLIALFLLLFLNTQIASAASIPIVPSNAANCLLPRDPANCNYEGVNYSNCQNGPIIVEDSYCGTTPANLCTGADDTPPWTFFYNAECIGTPDIVAPGITTCDFSYAWHQLQCNAADRCEDPSIGNVPGFSGGGGGSGSNTSGHVLYGYCNANSYDGSNPISACVSGTWYKQCCTSPGAVLPETYCFNGVCPAGQITTQGITTCDAAPPVTCSPSGSQYDQCGAVGCSDGSGYPSNHSVHITVLSCTDGSTQYQCTDNGVIAGQCGNPSNNPPSCNISSWTFSNPTPPSDTPVNVTVNGNSNFGWNGASYNLDNTVWVNVNSSAPPFQFGVNSDSAGPHTLQFSAISPTGRIICGSSGLNSFVTQGPTYYQIGGKTSSSTGSSLGGLCMTVYDDTNSQQTKDCNSTSSLWTNSNGNFWIDSFIRGGDAFAVRPPSTPPTGYNQPPSPSSYENQTVFTSKLDYNFTYTATSSIFDFSVSSPGNISLVKGSKDPGHSTTITKTTGTAEPVTLSLVGSIGGATYTFFPASCTPDTPCLSTLVFDTSSATPGTYSNLTVRGTSAGGTVRNSSTFTLTITAPAQPDLTTQNLAYSSPTTPGTPMTFSGIVTNSGNASTNTSFNARFCIDNPSCLTSTTGRVSDHTIAALAANTPSSTITSSGWTATAGNHVIYFCADTGITSAGVISESDETNNCSQTAFTVAAAGTPAAPTVSTSSLSCINPGYTGNGVAISWTNSGVTWVDISRANDSSFSTPYYHEAVTGVTSTTAPNGFNATDGSGPLTLNPATTYYVRTFNGTQNSQVATIPPITACSSSTCTGNVNLTLTPNPAQIAQTVTALASNLVSCTGKPIAVKTNDCNGTQVASCTSTSTGCSATFSSPATTGSFTYAVCIDKNNDGDTQDAGENNTSTLTVNTPPSGPCAWIQTFGGDVHSNTLINTPCGP